MLTRAQGYTIPKNPSPNPGEGAQRPEEELVFDEFSLGVAARDTAGLGARTATAKADLGARKGVQPEDQLGARRAAKDAVPTIVDLGDTTLGRALDHIKIQSEEIARYEKDVRQMITMLGSDPETIETRGRLNFLTTLLPKLNRFRESIDGISKRELGLTLDKDADQLEQTISHSVVSSKALITLYHRVVRPDFDPADASNLPLPDPNEMEAVFTEMHKATLQTKLLQDELDERRFERDEANARLNRIGDHAMRATGAHSPTGAMEILVAALEQKDTRNPVRKVLDWFRRKLS